jgi:hypothetical protein
MRNYFVKQTKWIKQNFYLICHGYLIMVILDMVSS